jgi:RNA polymerase sigma-70 factor (ECF subfamily)
MCCTKMMSEQERLNHVVRENLSSHMQPIISINRVKFEEAFHDHYDGLFRYAGTMIHEPEEVQDIVQHVFMELWRNRDNLVIHTSLQAFLYKSVYFKCMNVLKHRKVKMRHLYHTESIDKGHSYDPVMVEEISIKIKEATESMPEQCRKIFLMSRDEGLKYSEIANSLNLSIKTIENQMGKALRLLRSALQEYLNLIIFYSISIMP